MMASTASDSTSETPRCSVILASHELGAAAGRPRPSTHLCSWFLMEP